MNERQQVPFLVSMLRSLTEHVNKRQLKYNLINQFNSGAGIFIYQVQPQIRKSWDGMKNANKKRKQ